MNLSMLAVDIRLLFKSKWWYLFVIFSASVPLIASLFDDPYMYFLHVYSVGPLFFLPFMSTTITLDRQRGTIRNFFTTPISKMDYVLTKFLQWYILGIIYILISLPISVAHCFISGSFYLFSISVLCSLLIFFFITSLGVFISLLTKRASFLPMAISSFLSILFYLAYSLYPGALYFSTNLVLLRASPIVVMGDALDIWSYSSSPFLINHIACSSYINSILFLLALSALLFVSSCIIFCKVQDIFGHNIARNRRAYALVIFALIIAPFLIPTSDYFVDRREFVRGSSSAFDIVIEPEPLIDYGGMMEATLKIFIPYGMSGLRNVTLTLYSNDIAFVRSNFEFEYLNLKSEGGRTFFDIPVRMRIENVKGLIYGTYEIDITLLSRGGSDFLSTRMRVENRSVALVVSIAYLLTVILSFAAGIISRYRFSYE
ncbi:MAG: ABC transporter permease subunit [Candidatus Thermoplasmatota archaeon]|nr:ABC transporter permease subunit [Candidatus Thermoplasmatota archaeon]